MGRPERRSGNPDAGRNAARGGLFNPPAYLALPELDYKAEHAGQQGLCVNWLARNVKPHQRPGYVAVVLSLKKTGVPPGDATAEQIDFVADLAERYSFGELRVTHEQNLVLADVEQSKLFALWQEAAAHGLATPNIGLLTDMIRCPGGDFCSLANAKSLPIAAAIAERFDSIDFQHDIGEIELNISGCINACGHHHVGSIGILGVDKDGSECIKCRSAARRATTRPSARSSDHRSLPCRCLKSSAACCTSTCATALTASASSTRPSGLAPFKEHVYATPITVGNLVGEDEYV